MFHLCKQTRIYQGRPYCGYTSNNVPAEFKSLEVARKMQAMFNARNPVGWNIWDAETGKLVDGFDHFEE